MKAYLISHDGKELYIQVKLSGINPLCLLWDGVDVFIDNEHGGEDAYVTVADAIAWHARELLESHGRGGNREVLEALEYVMGEFLLGRIPSHTQ